MSNKNWLYFCFMASHCCIVFHNTFYFFIPLGMGVAYAWQGSSCIFPWKPVWEFLWRHSENGLLGPRVTAFDQILLDYSKERLFPLVLLPALHEGPISPQPSHDLLSSNLQSDGDKVVAHYSSFYFIFLIKLVTVFLHLLIIWVSSLVNCLFICFAYLPISFLKNWFSKVPCIFYICEPYQV